MNVTRLNRSRTTWTIVPLAFGNFRVNFLNASAGMTANVVSTVALAIVPFKAVGPSFGPRGEGPLRDEVSVDSGRIERDLDGLGLDLDISGVCPKSIAFSVVLPSPSSVSDLESRIVASSADETESRCRGANPSDEDRGRFGIFGGTLSSSFPRIPSSN